MTTINAKSIETTAQVVTYSGSINTNTSEPSGNFTAHYGPLIQGIWVHNDTKNIIPGFTLSRNSTTFRIHAALTGKIVKKKASSKIKIHGFVSGEREGQHNLVIYVERTDMSGNTEIGSPTPNTSLQNYGLTSGVWENQTDDDSTGRTESFGVLDIGAPAEELTYTIYLSSTNVGNTNFYLNHTISDSASPGHEHTTSQLWIEEYE